MTDLTITRLGHEGDGIADDASGGPPVIVPYALPGERVTIAADGESGRTRLVSVLTPSPDRIAPVCPHFTHCGGCTMQHLAPAAYAAWKTGILTGALIRHGLTLTPAPMVVAPPAGRRRAVLGAVSGPKRGGSGGAKTVVLGFHEPRGHRLFDLQECPVLRPEIVSRLPALRALVAPLLPRATAQGGEGLRVVVTATETGIDVVIEGARAQLDADQREALAIAARAAHVARVCLDRDPVYLAAEPIVRCGTIDVVPPPGVFLQAVPEIERAMASAVVAAIGKARRVADLFCGLGTFTFPLAARAQVTAADSDPRAIAALLEAHRRGSGVKPVTARVRDLFRDPLAPREFEGLDAVVLDPPRAGAAEQVARLARTTVPTIVMVSCAPGTLARDLATLVAGGYEIESLTPYDQFAYTAHLETVTVLRRPRR